MKEVWVVFCKMEECEEFDSTYNIIGVFEDRDEADMVEKEHGKFSQKHLHYSYSDIVRVELNKATHFSGDKQQFIR